MTSNPAPAVNYRNANAIYAHARLWIDTYPGDPGYRERAMLELDGWYRGAMEYVTGMPEPYTPTDSRAYAQGQAGEIPPRLLEMARLARRRVRELAAL